MSPDSTITPVKGPILPNPMRSRSTVICLATLIVFLAFEYLVLKSGYFDAGFAAASILFLREVVAHSLNHQVRTDEIIKKESK